MPILIKSSAGKRSCSVVNTSKDSNAPFDMDELVAALKGLTFKLEVKISDVRVASDSQSIGTSTHPSAKPSEAAKNVKSPVDLTNNSATAPKQVVAEQSMQDEKPPAPLPSHVIAQSSRQPEAVYSHDEAEFDTAFGERKRLGKPLSLSSTLQPRVIRDSVQPVKDEPETQQTTPRAAKIRSQSLTIGSTVTSCIISTDMTTDPPSCYMPFCQKTLMELVDLLTASADTIASLPPVSTVNVGDFYLGRSNEDDNWYRAVVESVTGTEVDIYFFDWGMREKVDKSRLRRTLEPKLYLENNPPCAIKMHLLNEPGSLVDLVFEMTQSHQLRIDRYDETSDAYYVTVIE